MGKIAMAAIGMTLVACLVYSAATEERHYAAYTPSVGLAQRKVMQGDIVKMEMQLAAKEVSNCVPQLRSAVHMRKDLKCSRSVHYTDGAHVAGKQIL